jgi:oligopeptide/dipeptide ABC transporter ATP-binding protein
MYGGKIQEIAPVRELFRNPLHPYTRGLLASLPRVDGPKVHRLVTIPGDVPDIHSLPPGCKFTSRCTERFEPCPDIEPPLVERGPGHWVRCHLHDDCHGYFGRPS